MKLIQMSLILMRLKRHCLLMRHPMSYLHQKRHLSYFQSSMKSKNLAWMRSQLWRMKYPVVYHLNRMMNLCQSYLSCSILILKKKHLSSFQSNCQSNYQSSFQLSCRLNRQSSCQLNRQSSYQMNYHLNSIQC